MESASNLKHTWELGAAKRTSIHYDCETRAGSEVAEFWSNKLFSGQRESHIV